MRIGLKISLGCLMVAAVVGVVGWRSAVTHDAVRHDVRDLRESSVVELEGAEDMLVALTAIHAASQELVVEAWRAHFEPFAALQSRGDLDRARIEIDNWLTVFADRLAASRRATEAALSLDAERGDETAVAGESAQIAWLDRLGAGLVVHRTRLDALVALARTDAPAAVRFLEEHIEPHYYEVMLPFIQRYRYDAQAEFDAVIAGVDAALAASDRHNRVAAAVAGMLAVFVGLLLTRSIARPIEMLAAAARQIGSGDLRARVATQRADEVGLLADSFNRMAERLQGTMVSKSYVDDIFRSMGEILLVSDSADHIRTVNRSAEEQLGWSEPELIGRDVHEIVRPADEPGELRIVTRHGSVIPVACTPTELNDASGRRRGHVWVAQNILHQKTIERELRCSIEEKEALLREVHHRVKNNLQVICSLLQLQAADAAAPEIASRLADSERRVRTMALVHEQLYHSGDLAYVDFRAYVESLANNVLASAGGSGRSIALRLDVESVALDHDLAILCGLILNELLANAMKHAFPDSRSGEIRVHFQRQNGRAVLTVADNGIGLGATANVTTPTSLGLRLVRAFARQLGADTTMNGDTGTCVTVAFDLPANGAARAPAPSPT